LKAAVFEYLFTTFL